MAQEMEGVIVAPKDKYGDQVLKMTSKNEIRFNIAKNPMKHHNLLHKHLETGKAELLRKGGVKLN